MGIELQTERPTFTIERPAVSWPMGAPTVLTIGEANYMEGDRYYVESHDGDTVHYYTPDGLPGTTMEDIATSALSIRASDRNGKTIDNDQRDRSADPVEVWNRPGGGYRYGSEHTVQEIDRSYTVLVQRPRQLVHLERASKVAADKRTVHADRAAKQRAYNKRIRNEAAARGITQAQLKRERAAARKVSNATTTDWQ